MAYMPLEEITALRNKLETTFTYPLKETINEMVTFMQNSIKLGYEVEQISVEKRPKLFMEKNTEETKSNTTQKYTVPGIYFVLNKRKGSGSNHESKTEMFKGGNVISAYPKFSVLIPDIKENENDQDTFNDDIQRATMNYDNEFILKVKTKTAKEQFETINLLERSFNVYCKYVPSSTVVLAGVERVERKEENDNEGLLTAYVYVQLRSSEKIDIIDGLIVRLIQITSQQEDPMYLSGQFPEDGEEWQDNENNKININEFEKF